MDQPSRRTITVFGGTGFLGRRIVRRLLESGFAVRIGSRHSDREGANSGAKYFHVDIRDSHSVLASLAGAFGAVNAVSLYTEHGSLTFDSIHVDAAANVARLARAAGVERLCQLSGVGAAIESRSRYIRSRGQGEIAVRGAFPAATIVRPTVMFGSQDAFLSPILGLLRRLPAFAMFGSGGTKLQPCYVGDVAAGIVRSLQREEAAATYEFGGPQILSYRALLELLMRHGGTRRLLVPMPFPLWRAIAIVAERLPHPPITCAQVELMRIDNVVSANAVGFAELGLVPQSIEAVLPRIAPKA